MARVQADLETIRLAELYASHPLLRTMPVPHMRLPEVDMEVPVLIKTSEEPRAGESARGGAPLKALSQKFDDVLGAQLSKGGVTLSAAERKRLRAALDERLSSRAVPTEISVDVHRVADELTSTALRMIEEMKSRSGAAEPAVPQVIADELRDAVRLEFLKLRTPPPRLMVLVTSAEIREAGATENLTRLRLKISEQGVEWTTIESDGVQRDRLVPE